MKTKKEYKKFTKQFAQNMNTEIYMVTISKYSYTV